MQRMTNRPPVRWRIPFSAAVATLTASPALAAPPHDLTGVWTNGWYTNLERPKDISKLVLTPEEAEAFEAPRRALNGMLASKADDVLGQAESEFNDKGPGLMRINGEIRSSQIVEPADGKLPWRADIKEKLGVGKEPVEVLDNVEDRPTDERCLTARGAGAPILNSPDTNFIQIVQAPDHVVIVSEKNHDARIVPLDGGAGRPGPVSWMGDSVGHWEGQTLVVETTGLRPGITRSGGFAQSDKSRVIERFTRTSAGELHYAFAVDDPGIFTAPWRAEQVFRASDHQVYEYACHEGNYALPSILAGARQAEMAAAQSATTATAP
jgi:hypothetical protein